MTVEQLRAVLAKLPKTLDNVAVSLGNEYQAHFVVYSEAARRVDITPSPVRMAAWPFATVVQGTPGRPETLHELWPLRSNR